MLNELCVTASTPTAESILGSFNVLPTFCPVTFARWERHAVAACQFRVRPDAARGRDRAGRLCAQTDLCDKETVGRGLDFTIAVDPSAMSRECQSLPFCRCHCWKQQMGPSNGNDSPPCQDACVSVASGVQLPAQPTAAQRQWGRQARPVHAHLPGMRLDRRFSASSCDAAPAMSDGSQLTVVVSSMSHE